MTCSYPGLDQVRLRALVPSEPAHRT